MGFRWRIAGHVEYSFLRNTNTHIDVHVQLHQKKELQGAKSFHESVMLRESESVRIHAEVPSYLESKAAPGCCSTCLSQRANSFSC